jgi:hypothetical protein
MNTPAPDYGEPWRIECGKHSIADTGDFDGYVQIYNSEARYRVAEIWNPDDEHEALFARIIACVNALAGIPDPAAHLASLNDAIERYEETLRVMNDALKEAHRIFGNIGHSQVIQRLCPDFAEVAEQVKQAHDPHA